jgi:hypothetical protein
MTKKRAIQHAAQWAWRRASRRREKATTDSASGAVGMTAGMSTASKRNERFSEQHGGDGCAYVVRKRKKRVIERQAQRAS